MDSTNNKGKVIFLIEHLDASRIILRKAPIHGCLDEMSSF